MRTADLARSPTVRLLFALRGLPRGRITVESFTAFGFVLLDEAPGREIVLGAIGRPWRPAGGLRETSAHGFAEFAEPGFAKMALNFLVTPAGEGSRVSTETRVHCTDGAARRAFRRYWRVIGPFSAYIRTQMLTSIKRDAES